MEIRLLNKEDIKRCHEVIVISFTSVVEKLDINNSNNSAFIKIEQLYNMLHKGIGIYGLFLDE